MRDVYFNSPNNLEYNRIAMRYQTFNLSASWVSVIVALGLVLLCAYAVGGSIVTDTWSAEVLRNGIWYSRLTYGGALGVSNGLSSNGKWAETLLWKDIRKL